MLNKELEIKEGYYYLHTNGNIIYKSMVAVNEYTEVDYFDSPFVVKYWHIKAKEAATKMINEIEVMAKELDYKE